MKTNTIMRNTFFAFIAICIIAISIAVVFSAAGFRTMSAYAMESEETIGCEGIEEIDRETNESFIEQEAFEEFENIMMLSGGSGRSSNEGIISGTTTSTLLFSDLTDVKYIPNANYFLINPRQGINDGSDNGGGTCTTVAMQMLMGYHNYYSDRRIIPEIATNGTRFLDANYGDLGLHPAFQRTHVVDTWVGGVLTNRGCPSIGTANTVYQDIFDRTWISSWYGIGQAVGLVKDGAVRFINTHTPQAARNGMSLTSGFFSASTARSDIDAGRPIVLGYQPIFTGADSFHVVPAYGYAKLDGVDGFLVHYGWGASRTQVWIPASWFGFQIRMSTSHTHAFIDTGVDRNNTHRELLCNTCGLRTVDRIYNISDSTILSVNYPLPNATIPNSVNIYSNKTASFTNQAITGIDVGVFYGNKDLTSVKIPNTVTSIGLNAFKGCNALISISLPFIGNTVNGISNTHFGYIFGAESYGLQNSYIPSSLKTVTITGGNSIASCAFYSCYSLASIIIETGVKSIGDNAFSYCTSLTNVTMPSSVESIGEFAFLDCASLANITISSSLKSIGNYAFLSCTSLTNFTMPASIKNIGIYTFSFCTSLTNVTLPLGVASIGDWAFYNCTNLSTVTIPASITSVGENAFLGTNVYLITFDKQRGYGGHNFIALSIGSAMPSITMPKDGGPFFGGYFTEPSGCGTQYYDAFGVGTRPYNLAKNTVLYAHWLSNNLPDSSVIASGIIGSTGVGGVEWKLYSDSTASAEADICLAYYYQDGMWCLTIEFPFNFTGYILVSSSESVEIIYIGPNGLLIYSYDYMWVQLSIILVGCG